MKIRKHVYFSGAVQGVGFRCRARYTAESLGLTGWVKNLPDGRVEMEVQGDPVAIDGMLKAFTDDTYIHITDIDSVDIPLEEGERKFRTQY